MSKNFKPLYKVNYSAQGTLTNEKIPNRIDDLFGYMMKMEYGDTQAVKAALSWLAVMMPPFKKFYRHYDTMQITLNHCKKLESEWQKENKMRDVPTVLKDKIYELYTAWWEGFNESGAGIRGSIFIPRDKQVKDALRNL